MSFGLEDSLAEVFGTDPTVSFVGTDRSAGTPVELTYERWELSSATVLFLGDIIGTGMTLSRVLKHLREYSPARCPGLSSVWIFTIGSRLGIRKLCESVAASGERNGPRINIVAFESLFELPDPATRTAFERFPFDLVRSPVHSAPEYEAARLRSVGSLFERCAIYDGGVRAFTPDEHRKLRLGWWQNLAEQEVSIAELADLTAGLSLYEMPLQDWIARIPWADQPGIDAEATHRLGREVLLMARELPLEHYIAKFIISDTRTS
ncbi:hypothetical protein ACIBQ1_54970 [Nonomuraea sp. NPDC050153]|uniref:hypothetical protein n=1 Tax=Nonomuraea sp. NPDC050153 TaxID=3364359 RepID=UPI00379CDB30